MFESDVNDFLLDSEGGSAPSLAPGAPVGPVAVVVDEQTRVPETSRAFPYAKEVVAKRAEHDALQESIKAEQARIAEINKQIEAIRKEMQAKIDALSKERSSIDEKIWDARRRLRALNEDIVRLERLMRMALDAELADARFLTLSDEFDKRTTGLKWREFALDHQMYGAKFIAAGKRVILADRMGLGKTLTSLMACDMNSSKRVLVIAPADVVSNFNSEIREWAPHRTLIMLSKLTKLEREITLGMLNRMDEFIITINYEAWRKDNTLIKSLIDLRLDTIILDEAHTFKNTSTSAYKGVSQLVMAENSCPVCGGKAEDKKIVADNDGVKSTYSAVGCTRCEWDNKKNDVKREFFDTCSVKMVIPMTGTPILNRPQDLFPMLHLVDPKNFHREYDFLYTYCWQDYDNKWRFQAGGLERVVDLLKGKYIGRTREDAGVVLPKQEIMIHEIDITPEDYPDQYRIIEQLSLHAQILLNNKAMTVLATIALITRKRQANVWPAGIVLRDDKGDIVFDAGEGCRESIKLDRLCRLENGEYIGLIPEFTENGNFDLGERVVVFSQFKTPLAELENRLQEAGIEVCRFDGDTPEDVRQVIKADFDRKVCDQPGYEKKFMVVLANYKTGGVGLNFTGATQMIMLDEEWNPGKNEQAYNRIDRIGQTQETTVHILRLNRTIDTWMAQLIESKRDMINGFEQQIDMQQAMMKALNDGEMI